MFWKAMVQRVLGKPSKKKVTKLRTLSIAPWAIFWENLSCSLEIHQFWCWVITFGGRYWFCTKTSERRGVWIAFFSLPSLTPHPPNHPTEMAINQTLPSEKLKNSAKRWRWCWDVNVYSELGVEQNRNRNFEQKPKLVSVQSGYRNYRHTGYNFQEEIRKNVLLLSLSPFTFWMNVQEEYILPAFFLKVVAGMPVFPVSWLNRNQFWFLLKVSVSVLFNP